MTIEPLKLTYGESLDVSVDLCEDHAKPIREFVASLPPALRQRKKRRRRDFESRIVHDPANIPRDEPEE